MTHAPSSSLPPSLQSRAATNYKTLYRLYCLYTQTTSTGMQKLCHVLGNPHNPVVGLYVPTQASKHRESMLKRTCFHATSDHCHKQYCCVCWISKAVSYRFILSPVRVLRMQKVVRIGIIYVFTEDDRVDTVERMFIIV